MMRTWSLTSCSELSCTRQLHHHCFIVKIMLGNQMLMSDALYFYMMCVVVERQCVLMNLKLHVMYFVRFIALYLIYSIYCAINTDIVGIEQCEIHWFFDAQDVNYDFIVQWKECVQSREWEGLASISILAFWVSGCLPICVSTGRRNSPKQAVFAAVLYFILIRGDVWDWQREY